MKFLIFPKQQPLMAWKRQACGAQHTHTSEARSRLLCVNVPSVCSKCQTLMTGAPVSVRPPSFQGVFAQVHETMFRQIKAVAGPFQATTWEPGKRVYTHEACSGR